MKTLPRFFLRTPRLLIFAIGAFAGSLGGWMAAAKNSTPSVSGDPAARAGSGAHAAVLTKDNPSVKSSTGSRTSAAGKSALAAESAEFAQSIRAIFRDTNEDRRLKTFESILERCSLEHYEVIVSLIRENDLRGCGSGDEWSLLWSNWGRRDPVRGMEFISAWDWSGWHPHAAVEAKNRTMMNWAQTDPETARRFVDRATDADPEDRSLVQGLVRGLASTDPAAATDWLFQTGLGHHGEYKTVVEAISRSGGHEALDHWFSEITGSEAPARDVQGFANVIAATKQAYEPDKAAAWLEQHRSEPWVQASDIVNTTARAYAERDPASAMEWATRNAFPEAVGPAMIAWSQKDPAAAEQWLRENPESPHYSVSVWSFANGLMQQNPTSARAWAASIPDPVVRERALKQIARD